MNNQNAYMLLFLIVEYFLKTTLWLASRGHYSRPYHHQFTPEAHLPSSRLGGLPAPTYLNDLRSFLNFQANKILGKEESHKHCLL